jgi:sortase A
MMFAGILLIAAALFLVLFNIREDHYAGQASEEVCRELRDLIPDDPSLPDTGKEQKDAQGDLPPYVRNPEMAMPVYRVDGYDYIGILEIPDLGLSLPIMSEWSYPGLRIAPCRYTGTIYLKNMVIAAHNYQTHFGRLKELSPGAQVKFTDADGNVFFYEVMETEILAPTAIEEMTDSGWDLSLFTCTIGGKTRVTVRCRMTSQVCARLEH